MPEAAPRWCSEGLQREVRKVCRTPLASTPGPGGPPPEQDRLGGEAPPDRLPGPPAPLQGLKGAGLTPQGRSDAYPEPMVWRHLPGASSV